LSAEPHEDKRPRQADKAFHAYIKCDGLIPETTCEMALQFQTGAFRHPPLAPDKPERRCRPIGAAKHSFQKLVRARGARSSVDPKVLVLATSMIHMPLQDVPLSNAVIDMTCHFELPSSGAIATDLHMISCWIDRESRVCLLPLKNAAERDIEQHLANKIRIAMRR
jgi:hypothetical protein